MRLQAKLGDANKFKYAKPVLQSYASYQTYKVVAILRLFSIYVTLWSN